MSLAEPIGPATDVIGLFHLDQAWPAIEQLRNNLGTATSGPLGSLVISFFLISLLWCWVKNKFDTWSFWDLFLRLFMVAAGILCWHTLFAMLDQSMDWLATGGGNIDPYQAIYNLIYQPFTNLVIAGHAWGDLSGLSMTDIALIPLIAIEGFLEILVIAAFCLTVISQQLLTMLLYCIGPIFLACWLFDPLADLWMRWVRSYLTVKAWMMVIYFSLFILSNSLSPTDLLNAFSAAQSWTLPSIYLLVFLLFIVASFPIARGLIGGAVTPAFSGAIVPGVAAAAGGAVLTAAGMAIGSAAGPVGTAVGGAVGRGAGNAAGVSVAPKRQAS